jgi:hypothetical protein
LTPIRLSRGLVTAITLAVATVILFSGLAYAVVRPINYRSEATLVLAPTPERPSDLAGVLDSFQRSGTAVTYVELLASDDILKAAGNPPVSVRVRSVPDSRVIRVSTEGSDKNIVQPALRSILTAATQEQQKLVDVWELKVLQTPSGPSQASTTTSLILLATLLLALLGAISAWTLMRRYGTPPDRRAREAARAEAMATTGWLTSEGPRYPTSR